MSWFWLKPTNAKEIGTLYLILGVFAGMIGTAFSVLIKLELFSPGVQFLQEDYQLFNVIIFVLVFFIIFFSALTHMLKNKYKILTIYLVNVLKYTMIFLIFMNIFLHFCYIYSHWYTIDFNTNVLPSGVQKINNNEGIPMDPVSWWPSGVLQGWTIVGTVLATFFALSKIPGVSPRARVLASLARAGVSTTQVTYHSSLGNSVGFNRMMWGLTEYRKTGIWASLVPVASQVKDKENNNFVNEAVKDADQSKVDSIVNEVNGNEFFPVSNLDFSDFVNNLTDVIFKETMQILKPVYVEGHLDDLIGQRMFIETTLFIMCICIILLFIVFIGHVIFLLNKDRIIKKFDNKFITFYVKYQAFISWFTLLCVPIFIFTGLFTLSHGLHWLITHQIPFETLDVDLHKFISG